MRINHKSYSFLLCNKHQWSYVAEVIKNYACEQQPKRIIPSHHLKFGPKLKREKKQSYLLQMHLRIRNITRQFCSNGRYSAKYHITMTSGKLFYNTKYFLAVRSIFTSHPTHFTFVFITWTGLRAVSEVCEVQRLRGQTGYLALWCKLMSTLHAF